MSPTTKRKRCPNGFRKHPQTGVCTPVNKRSPTGTRKKKDTTKKANVPKKLFRVVVVDKDTNQALSPPDMVDSYWEQRTLLENTAKYIGIDDVNVSLDEDGQDLSSYFILFHKGVGSSQKTLLNKCSRVLNKPFEVRYRDYEYDVLKTVTVTVQKME